MKMNSTNVMFLLTLMWSIMMSMSTNSMIMLWMMMEMSTISFIPIMMNKKMKNSESVIKFFLIQSMTSSMIIYMIIMTMIFNTKIPMNILIVSLIMKMGGVPFQNWLVSTIEGINYLIMTILISIMKIPPLVMIEFFSYKLNMIIIMSMIMAPIMMINQTKIKKIIIYSSIFNMSMALMLLSNSKMWITFIMMYTILLMMNILDLKKYKIKNLNQTLMNNKKMNFSIWISFLSMGGMPPLTGFINKLIVIKTLIEKKEMIILFLMVISSTMVIFMYMKLSLSSILFSISMNKMKYLTLSFSNPINITFSCMTLPMMMMLKLFN